MPLIFKGGRDTTLLISSTNNLGFVIIYLIIWLVSYGTKYVIIRLDFLFFYVSDENMNNMASIIQNAMS
jgi:hypothetical protein